MGCTAQEIVECRAECANCTDFVMECKEDTSGETIADQIGNIFGQ